MPNNVTLQSLIFVVLSPGHDNKLQPMIARDLGTFRETGMPIIIHWSTLVTPDRAPAMYQLSRFTQVFLCLKPKRAKHQRAKPLKACLIKNENEKNS